MADQENKAPVNEAGNGGSSTETGSVPKVEDTRTRKTVRLSANGMIPSVKPGAPIPPPVSRPGGMVPPPIPGRQPAVSSDTGNIPKVTEDTKTRKTIKLKPMAPADHKPISLDSLTAKPAASARSTDTGSVPKAVEEDTRTRRTVKLTNAPAVDGVRSSIGTPVAPPVAKPAASAQSTDTGNVPKAAEDTRTRRTVKLTPAAPAGGSGSNDSTVRLTKPSAAPSAQPAATEAEPATINLKMRPSQQPAKPAAAPAAQAAQAAKPAATPATPAATPAPAAAKPAAGKTAGDKKAVAVNTKAMEGGPKGPPSAEAMKDMTASKLAAKPASQASPIYLALAVVTLLLLAGTTVFTFFSYTNTWETGWTGGKKVELISTK